MTDPRYILVLDDDPAIGLLVCRVARRAGMRASYCANAEQLFEVLRDARPTHLFLDMVMPGVDGVEVINHLARAHIRANIILMSGFDGRVLHSAERTARARAVRSRNPAEAVFATGPARHAERRAGQSEQ